MTPAPVRGSVWLGARTGAWVAGAADCVPDAVRGVAAAFGAGAVVGVTTTGGAVTLVTRGVFSHGGHGAL